MSGNYKLKNLKDEVTKDIIELEQKINGFKSGRIQEDRFKHYRLTRGVYGQRQLGVHMFRTKIPYGKLTAEQLVRLADISEKYTNGNLHITTRQNIQMHYVKLKDAPAIWTEMAELDVTAREACGNTVRNITASANAGIDPDEAFDVIPYVEATFHYFLRNPICQEMGRKIKIAFSSSDKDSAYTYFHDFGFIPRIKEENGKKIRGFKVVIAGGLGAQSIIAPTAYEFLPTDEIIPFMEAAIRVFDRYGEREKRFKARMKFLVKSLGLATFLELVEAEKIANKNQKFAIEIPKETIELPSYNNIEVESANNSSAFDTWLMTNVFEQKQKGWFAAQVRVPLGNIDAETARKLAKIVKKYTANDFRFTVNQGLVLRFVKKEYLAAVFNALEKLGLAAPGFDTIADITACPGTDTCNLGVTNSTALAVVLEEVIREEYPHLINERDIKIKISGCMNACGQHMAANIGMHGSSIKKRPLVVPATQIVLGGGIDEGEKGFIAEKVIKVPAKKTTDALRFLLDDYDKNATDGEYFNDYYYRQGKMYFYNLLKPLADLSTLEGSDFYDWGEDHTYKQAIGVGECAGVAYDVVSTIVNDAKEKIELAQEAIEAAAYADSIYHSYAAFVIGAKALLLTADVRCNTYKGIIEDFQTHFIDNNKFDFEGNFGEEVLKINKIEASAHFAKTYFQQAASFFEKVIAFRNISLGTDDKVVIDQYYKA